MRTLSDIRYSMGLLPTTDDNTLPLVTLIDEALDTLADLLANLEQDTQNLHNRIQAHLNEHAIANAVKAYANPTLAVTTEEAHNRDDAWAELYQAFPKAAHLLCEYYLDNEAPVASDLFAAAAIVEAVAHKP